MLSAIVDDLLIRTGNPEDGVTRTGEGATERDPYRSQFNYLWKSLMPGIKQTVVGHGTVVKDTATGTTGDKRPSAVQDSDGGSNRYSL